MLKISGITKRTLNKIIKQKKLKIQAEEFFPIGLSQKKLKKNPKNIIKVMNQKMESNCVQGKDLMPTKKIF